MNMLSMVLVAAIGGLAWGFVMPDMLSAIVVALVWGGAVGHFWARNFPTKERHDA